MQIGKAIKALINAAGYDCYASVIPQSATGDVIVYNVISDVPASGKNETSKIDTYRIQINIFSSKIADCLNLASSVRTALDNTKGSYGGLTIDRITFIDQGSDYDFDQDKHTVRQDYYIRQKI